MIEAFPGSAVVAFGPRPEVSDNRASGRGSHPEGSTRRAQVTVIKSSPSKWFVYILKCFDNSLYVGATNDVARRFKEHLSGKGSKYVRSRSAEKVVYTEEFDNKFDAFTRERELKGFSRQKKLKLIE